MRYSEEERKIFGPYYNGAEDVYADQIRAYRQFMVALDGDPNSVIKQTKDENKILSAQAKMKLADATRAALSMIPFDTMSGYGATDSDFLKVAAEYLEWMEKNVLTG